MLLRRVIPCLDVDKGRVVKGVEFVNLRDAGDPVELAVRYQDEGADEIVFLDITASHERRETGRRAGPPLRRRRVHPVHDRGRRALGGGRPGGARRGGRQGVGQLGGGGAARAAGGAGRGVRRAVRGAGDRRPPRGRTARTASTWRAAARAGRARRGRVGARGRGARRGEILLTSMDRDGTEDGYELELTRAVADAVDVPVIASGGAGTLDHLVDAVERGRRRRGPVRVDLPLRPVHACARPRSACARPGSRCGCDGCGTTCASASGACPAWSGCCPPSRGCRRPTWWAARCATCCAARTLSTSTSPWRATRARRAGAGGAAGRQRARARALRHGDRAGARDLCSTSPPRAPRPTTSRGALPRARAGRAARRGPAPARLHDQRDGGRRSGATTSGTCTTRTAGSADLEAGAVRILHERSFLDDPTRLLRAVRYETRLGFRMDEDTERLRARGGRRGRAVDGLGARVRTS